MEECSIRGSVEERVVLQTKLLKLSSIYIFSTRSFLFFLRGARSIPVVLFVFLCRSFSFKILHFTEARLSAICKFYGCAWLLSDLLFPSHNILTRVKNISESFSLYLHFAESLNLFNTNLLSGADPKLLFLSIINVVTSLFSRNGFAVLADAFISFFFFLYTAWKLVFRWRGEFEFSNVWSKWEFGVDVIFMTFWWRGEVWERK